VPEHAVIGNINGGTVTAEFTESVLGAVLQGETNIDTVMLVRSGPNLSTARNVVCRTFLDCQTAPWLFLADSDMWWAPDAIDRLIAAADPVDRPVVGALCRSVNQDDPAGGEPYTTMYELAEKDGDLAFSRYRQWPEDAVVRVAATGAAALLIHRGVLERVEKASREPGAPWFRESVTRSALIGEDLTFCLRCGAAGIPVHVATAVRVGHMKTTMLI
jgi:GT2 family glycosyltransferase